MEEMSKHGRIGDAAMKAGMDRKTARRYVQAGKLPSEMVAPRAWRTREDPFAEDWAEVVALLEATPELEAKTIFEVLEERHPGRYEAGQLRTLQRHVRQWRAEHGPDREVVLAQQHRPGEASQVDFTWATSLGVTIMGALFVHMLCVFTLPFSNWQWASVCLSESLSALRRGVQAALFQLGRVPAFNQTDNSTAATHRIPDGKSVEADGGEAAVQRGVPRADAALRDDRKDDSHRRKGAEWRCRGEQQGHQASTRASAARSRPSRLRERQRLGGIRAAHAAQGQRAPRTPCRR